MPRGPTAAFIEQSLKEHRDVGVQSFFNGRVGGHLAARRILRDGRVGPREIFRGEREARRLLGMKTSVGQGTTRKAAEEVPLQ